MTETGFTPIHEQVLARSGAERMLTLDRDGAIKIEYLQRDPKFRQLSVATFFSALQRARRIIVDFPRADEPRLRAAKAA